MSNEIAASGEKALSYLTGYVGDIKEMEEQILTLENARDQLQEKIAEKKRSVRAPRYERHEQPRTIKKEVVLTVHDETEYKKAHRKEHPKLYQIPQRVETKTVVWSILLLFVSMLVLLYTTAASTGWYDNIPSAYEPFAAVVLLVVIFVVPVLLPILIAKARNASYRREAELHNEQEDMKALNEYRQRNRQYNDTVRKENATAYAYNARLPQINAQIDAQNEALKKNYERKLQEMQAGVALLEKELIELCNSIQELKEKLAQLYALDIIPPGYRTYDCVFGLYEIFVNRKKDNMPDAVVLYDDYVFRGQIIKGMGNIMSRLGSLTGLMASMGVSLERMQGQVVRLTDNVYEMADNQARLRSSLEDKHHDMMRETQLRRYALESISSSMDKIARYCDSDG